MDLSLTMISCSKLYSVIVGNNDPTNFFPIIKTDDIRGDIATILAKTKNTAANIQNIMSHVRFGTFECMYRVSVHVSVHKMLIHDRF